MVAAMVGWMDEKMASAGVGWLAAGTAAGWVASKVSSTVAAMVVAKVAAMGVAKVVETVVVLAARMALLKAERKAVQMEQCMVAATDSLRVGLTGGSSVALMVLR